MALESTGPGGGGGGETQGRGISVTGCAVGVPEEAFPGVTEADIT